MASPPYPVSEWELSLNSESHGISQLLEPAQIIRKQTEKGKPVETTLDSLQAYFSSSRAWLRTLKRCVGELNPWQSVCLSLVIAIVAAYMCQALDRIGKRLEVYFKLDSTRER